MDEKLVLGKDYETVDSIIEKTKLKTYQAINYRINLLKKRGVIITPHYDPDRKVYWLRADADKIINIKYTKIRKK
jgi:hypothetical protein